MGRDACPQASARHPSISEGGVSDDWMDKIMAQADINYACIDIA